MYYTGFLKFCKHFNLYDRTAKHDHRLQKVCDMQGARLTPRQMSSASYLSYVVSNTASRTHAHTHTVFWSLLDTWDSHTKRISYSFVFFYIVPQKEKLKTNLWNNCHLIQQICSNIQIQINLWIVLMFLRHLYRIWQCLCMQELWQNVPEFVSSSLTFAIQLPHTIPKQSYTCKWSKCSFQMKLLMMSICVMSFLM